jgi:ankyrin repeat protein
VHVYIVSFGSSQTQEMASSKLALQVRKLVQQGVSINVCSCSSSSLLSCPVHSLLCCSTQILNGPGSKRTDRAFISSRCGLQALDKYGYTALHHAVLSRDLQTVLMCLPRKSPIGECTAIDHAASDTLTALHIACKLGQERAAHAIVDYGSWMV